MIKNNLLRKQYTLNETNYQLKIPMELDACIPEDDCVRLIRQFVEEMDLTALYATYERMPSEKYASPEIMLKIMLYAYHERKDVSSRTIEKNCKRDINYMYLLEGRKAPDHAAIARFRSKHFAKCARHFMAQMTKFLIKLEQVTTTEVFIDGTKIESAANRYLCMAKSRDQTSGKISAENSASGWRYRPKARTEAIMAKTGQEETCEENLKEAKGKGQRRKSGICFRAWSHQDTAAKRY